MICHGLRILSSAMIHAGLVLQTIVLVYRHPLIEMAEPGGVRSVGKPGWPSEAMSANGGRELALLLACLRLVRTKESNAALRELLMRPVDWTCFARKLVKHDLGELVAQALLGIAPDLLPDDIRYALQTIADEVRPAGGIPEETIQ